MISTIPLGAFAETCTVPNVASASATQCTLTQSAITEALGWVPSDANRCGGYYIEVPMIYPKDIINTDKLLITSDQGLFSFHGTSVSQGKVTITRSGQQITANKGYLYRDPQTGKLSAVDLEGNVRLHEPNQLVVGTRLHYDLKTSAKSLNDILYRSTIYGDLNPAPAPVSYQEQQSQRAITQMSAWGQASSFSQEKPKIYNFADVSYTTCPPTTSAWKMKAKTLRLNKITGRGTATHAVLYMKSVPVFYAPYFNFPIDSRRQTGFLFPKIGSSNQYGPFFRAPFYWNMAPNYDSTITPSYLSKSGLQLSDSSRYLTRTNKGQVNATVLPYDQLFQQYKIASQGMYQNSTSSFTQASLAHLETDSTTRKAFSWQDEGQYSDTWSSTVNYSWVGDDYYVRDFNGGNVNEVSVNQLLQLGEVNYTGPHWNFMGRVQSYQTLNQVDLTGPVPTSYSRFPQFTLGGSYPDDHYGFEYFINSDVTRFDIRNSPGDSSKLPMGVRTNIQPGISRPINLPYFYFTPRAQFAMTKYEIGDVSNTPRSPGRTIPIFDVNSGLYFDRNTQWFGQSFKQTLEPHAYYTYIPYQNQTQLPLFDTTLNYLTYDQLFTYNRFSSLDRIGDANQIGVGVTTEYIDSATGYKKIMGNVGEIYYFKKRQVTLCSTPGNCSSFQNDPNNLSIRSPINATLTYLVTPGWNATATSLWNTKTSRIDNQNFSLQYAPLSRHVINFGYNFVRSGDIPLPWVPVNSPTANLSQTDISAAWPVARDWTLLGRWTENWNQKRLQNLLAGLQYDSCCWAVRTVFGRTFLNLRTNNTFKYNNQFFIEFSLKGLGNYGPVGDATTLLSNNISGYSSNFGRDY